MRSVRFYRSFAKLEFAGDGGEFFGEGFVESPEGFFVRDGRDGGEVAVNEREFWVFDIEVEGVFDEAFVAVDILGF